MKTTAVFAVKNKQTSAKYLFPFLTELCSAVLLFSALYIEGANCRSLHW